MLCTPTIVLMHSLGLITLLAIKARWGSRGKKCSILIFQYVIELEKTNKMQKTGG